MKTHTYIRANNNWIPITDENTTEFAAVMRAWLAGEGPLNDLLDAWGRVALGHITPDSVAALPQISAIATPSTEPTSLDRLYQLSTPQTKLAILQALCTSPARLTLRELALIIRLSKTATHHQVHQLEKAGFLTTTPFQHRSTTPSALAYTAVNLALQLAPP